MATWNGWESDLLLAAAVDFNGATQEIIDLMRTFAPQSCTNNPCGISHALNGSTDCTLVTLLRHAQNYRSHGDAASAFSAQLHGRDFPHLLAAFKSGDPFTVADPAAVKSDLDRWEDGVGEAYAAAAKAATSSGSGGHTPKALGGWADLRKSFNHAMPKALAASHASGNAALRSLHRAHKLRP